MNLFRLSDDPVKAAELNQDLHVRKIIVEGSQLLANCYSLQQLEHAPRTQKGEIRKYSHPHHPITKFSKATLGNFNWVLKHAQALCSEYTFRSGKIHFCQEFIAWVTDNKPLLVPAGDEQLFPQCFITKFPECFVDGNPVLGYQNYYRAAKREFVIRGKVVKASWTNRPVPDFMRT